jgi:hypothetical protein
MWSLVRGSLVRFHLGISRGGPLQLVTCGKNNLVVPYKGTPVLVLWCGSPACCTMDGLEYKGPCRSPALGHLVEIPVVRPLCGFRTGVPLAKVLFMWPTVICLK